MSWHARSLALAVVGGMLWSAPVRADLKSYVERPEGAYRWKLTEKINHPLGTVYDLHLVSQTWQEITWEHQLQVYQPKDVAPTPTILLWNQGGSANPGTIAYGMELASRIKAPVAFLYGIPNQPLFGGKKEDALIAETFMRYLQTKDESWPLLLPMVKSLVKAMDALQAFSKEEWKQPLDSFIVSGGSKRGWTTWLTAAADPRVKAIAPLVIDTLNMRAQMPHQVKSFGTYSEQIADYTRLGLTSLKETPDVKRLFDIVDPYSYRDKLTLPKLLINGNNDPYWTVDALNLYWDDLKGDKWVMYVPNAGHNLQQKDKDGHVDRSRVVNALSTFARQQIAGKSLPQLQWKHDDVDGKMRLTVQAKPAPVSARLWSAQAPTLDFRKAEWVEQPAVLKDGTVTGEVAPPAKGCLAFYGDLEYELDGLKYHLSTQIRVAGKPEEK
jgi:PhoPQ-activated pathogenicity-related protein